MSYIDNQTDNPYSYQPNFILVSTPVKGQFFGDILPAYRSAGELTNFIVTSWESLSHFTLHGQNFLTCVLSFLSQAINNTAYQSYLIINSTYQQILELPNVLGSYKKHVEFAFATISAESTRELWWLEVKLDIRTLLDKVTASISGIWKILQKFYLAALVFVCLGFLSLSTPLLASNNSNSFLAKFLNNNTYISKSSLIASRDFQVTTGLDTVSRAVIVSTISAYTVNDGDTIDKISESFGVKSETICFNNYQTLESCTIKKGDKLYIPWVNGYIYNAAKETLATDLSSLYEVSVDEIVAYNNFSYNPVTLNFPKDSLVLIPTTDYPKVDEANKKEQARKEAILKSAGQALATKTADQAARSQNLSSKAVPRTAAAPDLNYMKNGFIWPTVGSISRCVQPGHVACDIANFNSPSIVASKAGVVIAKRFDAGGYGNMVEIDHGKDEKGNSVKTLYAHMAGPASVSVGQKVSQGQPIGVMGRTGASTGIHLHYECKINGVKQNPLEVCLP